MPDEEKLVQAIAEKVIEANDPIYKSVVFYGSQEKRKELLDSIETGFRKKHKGKTCIRKTGEEIANDVIRLLEEGTPLTGQKLYECDLLIIDDFEKALRLQTTAQFILSAVDRRFLNGDSVVFGASGPISQTNRSSWRDRMLALIEGAMPVFLR